MNIHAAFSSHARILMGISTNHSPPAPPSPPFFLSGDQLARSNVKDQSTVAKRAETTVDDLSLTNCI